ncbi:unnamed protein product [Rotaria magnacalcarata]|uniref:Uncharacterized protein n=3 Tax=Rotaria magnacalcarata TaxID=392030 RepID=A0A820M617_9BILA|nr:unnamed protein product [Rotaria magnacalcarata]
MILQQQQQDSHLQRSFISSTAILQQPQITTQKMIIKTEDDTSDDNNSSIMNTRPRFAQRPVPTIPNIPLDRTRRALPSDNITFLIPWLDAGDKC